MALDLKKIAAAAKEAGLDQTKTVAGGGDFKREVLAEGPCKLRFVGYVELGTHVKKFKGQDKKSKRVRLAFEVTGPKHPPRVADDGTVYPNLAYIEENLTQSEKGNWPKLFSLLNHERAATHAVELLGKAYIGRIVHRKWKKRDDPADKESWTGVDVELRDDTGYTVRAPFRDDPDTGDVIPVKVDPATVPLQVFLWNAPDLEQWESIYIAGEYPERKDEKTGKVIKPAASKNVLQNKIKAAIDFKGSPIYDLLVAKGLDLSVELNPEDEGEEADEAPAAQSKPAPAARKGASKLADLDDDIPY